MLQSPMSPHSMQQSPRLGTPHSQVCIAIKNYQKEYMFKKFLIVFRAKKARLAQDLYLLRVRIGSHLLKFQLRVILDCRHHNIGHD